MTAVEELVETLLFEGYALYPYTPGATKNATPTPFGIVYPPVYATPTPTTFDHLRMPGIVEAGAGATLALSVRFLQASGVRHEAVARRIELPATSLEALEASRVAVEFDFDGLCGRVAMNAQALTGGLVRVTCCVHNTTEVDDGLARAEALTHSLLSTHVVATVGRGRFLSPSAPPGHASGAVMTCVAVNTFPVLASDADDVLLGAAIVLPDHPQIAPESKGSLFDSTEIEEALRLHLLALSDDEREQLQEHDPALRTMLERAIAAAPQDLASLHGRVTIGDPSDPVPDPAGTAGSTPDGRAPERSDPPGARPRTGGPDPVRSDGDHPRDGRAAPTEADAEVRGEQQARLADGSIVRRGDHVRLRVGDDGRDGTSDPDASGDPTAAAIASAPGRHAQDHLLTGKTATIERIYVDYDDRVHLCVTVDDDPGQQLMRDIGRYLYFKTTEVEVVE